MSPGLLAPLKILVAATQIAVYHPGALRTFLERFPDIGCTWLRSRWSGIWRLTRRDTGTNMSHSRFGGFSAVVTGEAHLLLENSLSFSQGFQPRGGRNESLCAGSAAVRRDGLRPDRNFH